MTLDERSKLVERLLKSADYRHALWEEHIPSGIAAQVLEMRKERGWSQQKLGEKAGMAQARIHEIEDPDFETGRNTETLIRLAKALDVVLEVHFISYGEFADRMTALSPETLGPLPFERDPRIQPVPGAQLTMELVANEVLPRALLPFRQIKPDRQTATTIPATSVGAGTGAGHAVTG
jgi:transcriptional regulator with XRE-family HTH domain